MQLFGVYLWPEFQQVHQLLKHRNMLLFKSDKLKIWLKWNKLLIHSINVGLSAQPELLWFVVMTISSDKRAQSRPPFVDNGFRECGGH